MIDREAPSFVAVGWLRIAPLVAVCACTEAPTRPVAHQELTVANFNLSASGVTVYEPGASGDVTPIRMLAGGNTALTNATGVARDVAGNLYVTNPQYGAPGGGSITVYAAEASGNASPSRTITGDQTGLYQPVGIAVDRAGNVYAAGLYTVTIYAPNANGNAVPIRKIDSYYRLGGIALDTADNLYISSGDAITVYAAGTDATPIRTITGVDCPSGIGLDVAGDLYVANPCGGSITVYAAGADGNAAPTRKITGGNTGLNGPSAIALDAARNLYIANAGGYLGNAGSVTVYAPGASGNAIPTRTIAGCSTEIGYPGGPRGIALDPAGNLYVAVHIPTFRVLVYEVRASKTVARSRVISGCKTGLNGPMGVARDAAGNLYVANHLSSTLTVYAAGASGDAAPIRTIAGANTGLSDPNGIALDAAGNLYVANWPSSITVYAAGASGDVTPIRTIAGLHTRLAYPTGIAVDAGGRVYVANEGQNANGASVTVYAPQATGDATPTAVITGSFRTGLTYPQGLALDATGNVYVADVGYPTCAIRVYAPDTTGALVPMATIAGSNTGLAGYVRGIALDGIGQTYVATENAVLVFAADATGNAAPRARIVDLADGLNAPTYLTF